MASADCNWWQYSKWVYNVGRTARLFPFDEDEKAAVIAYVSGEWEARPWLAPRLDNRVVEPNALKEDEELGYLYDLEKLGSETLGRMVQLIGRNLKVVPPTEDEKTLCDALFEATGTRKERVYTPAEDESGSEGGSDSGSDSASASESAASDSGEESTSESGSESQSASGSQSGENAGLDVGADTDKP